MAQLTFQRPIPPHSHPRSHFVSKPAIPPSPSTLNLLHDAFYLCRHDWVRRFLFTPDPHDVTVFTSLNTAFALYSRFSEISIGRSPTNTDIIRAYVDGAVVMVPAFSVGSVTVGVGVKERYHTVNSDCKGWLPSFASETSERLRWVGDATTGHFLFLRDNRDPRYLGAELVSIVNLSARRRTMFTFHREPFFRVMKTSSDDSAFLQQIHSTLAFVQSIMEHRDCHRCGAMLYPSCNCPSKIESPESPMDLAKMRSSIIAHLGRFQGVEQIYICTYSTKIASAEFGAKLVADLVDDPVASQALIRWAVSDRIMNKKTALKYPLSSSEDKLFGYMVEKLDDPDEQEVTRPLQITNVDGAEEAEEVVEKEVGSATAVDDSPDTRNTTEKAPRSSTKQVSSDTPNASNMNSSEADCLDKTGDDRISKMKLRRQKNREAARKSNYKKKLVNEQLRHDLQESRTRLEQLQVREAQLRLENSQLRRLASTEARVAVPPASR